MADIRAFHAMRYTKSAGEAKELTCPPYDIISEADADGVFGKKPHNVIRLELPRGEEPYKSRRQDVAHVAFRRHFAL